MKIRIRNWDSHFERDRSKQWKSIQWVPIPNKQGAGYRKIMKQKNNFEIYACWIALVLVASKCDPRGDLTKYDIEELSDLTMICEDSLVRSIEFLAKKLDWIEVIDKNVNDYDKSVCQTRFDSSILFNSILSYLILSNKETILDTLTWRDSFEIYQKQELEAYTELCNDQQWIQKRQRYHPRLDILLSLEKAHVDFWSTEAGWEHKKKSKSNNINWITTYQNALTMKSNQVWITENKSTNSYSPDNFGQPRPRNEYDGINDN